MFAREPEPVRVNREAASAQRQALVADGVNGVPITAPCALAPATDKVTVQRIGPAAKPSSVVSVTVQVGQGHAYVNLRPADARRIAAALLDGADECDGMALLRYVVPATPAAAMEHLARSREEGSQ